MQYRTYCTLGRMVLCSACDILGAYALCLSVLFRPPAFARQQLYERQSQDKTQKQRYNKGVAYSASSILAVAALSAAVGALIAKAACRGK